MLRYLIERGIVMKHSEKVFVMGKSNIEATVKYIVERITYIIKNIGPRAPGSAQELKAQKLMAQELKKWSDEVDIEGFTVNRQAFMGFIPFTVASAVISVFLYWMYMPLKAFGVTLLGIIPLLFEFGMYKQFCDPLFKGHPSHNVTAVRKPREEVKKRIYFVAHADSQYEWLLNYKLGGVGMKLILIPAVVGLFVTSGANFVMWVVSRTINPNAIDMLFFRIVGIILIAFIPFFIAFLFFQSYTKSVPGANDNLSGCLCCMSVLKSLEEAGIRFENTEVRVLLTGSEEAGLRGAKAYIKAHLEELKEKETVVIAVDTIRDIDDMAIYDRDLSGTVKHDKQVKELLKEAAKNCGMDLPYSSVYIGSTDAAAFTQAKIKATGFAAMDPTPPRYYHTRLDDVDMLVPEALKAGVQILVETACLYDEKGLK